MSNMYNMEEKEFSIEALLFEILLRWRKIILWMIVGALLLGGMNFVKSYMSYMELREAAQKEVSPEEKLAQLKAIFSDKQINDLDNLIENEALAKEKIEQYEKSEIMKIDYTAVPKELLLIDVSTSDATRHDLALNAYYTMLKSASFDSYITGKVKEISITDVSSTIQFGINQLGESENSSLLCVSVINSSEETCKEIVGYIKEYLRVIHDSIGGNNSYEIISDEYTCVYDAAVKEKQETISESIRALKSSIINARESLGVEERKYYMLMTGEKGKETETVLVSPTVNVKYVILGAFVFAFIYCAYVCLSIIFNKKINEYEDIVVTFGIPHIMDIAADESQERSRINRFILKVRDRNKPVISNKQAIEIATAKIMVQLQNEEKRVYCMGNEINGQTLEAANGIKRSLADKGVEMVILCNVMYSDEEIAQLENAKNIFLMETVGKSRYDDIYEEIAFIKRLENRILGMIVVK